MEKTTASPGKANRLLAKLTAEELDKLRPHMETVELPLEFTLIAPNEPIEHCYFPTTLLGSLVTILEDGFTVEAGTIGREGMSGVPVLLNATMTPMQTVVQVAGTAIRVPSSAVKKLYDEGKNFYSLMNRYIHTMFVVASQSAACNRRHQLDQRLARWLLMSSDGIASDHVGITQGFLATMLGVRRSGVTEAAIALQEQGMIRYSRGAVEIVDRGRLEQTSCECYGTVKEEYQRLLA